MMLLALTVAAAAQPEWPSDPRPGLYAFTADGTILQVHHRTGAATVLGNVGHPVGGAATDEDGHIYTLGNDDALVRLNPDLRSGEVLARFTGRPPGYQVVGLDVVGGGPVPDQARVILSAPGGEDHFYNVRFTTGVYTPVGPTGRRDLVALYNGHYAAGSDGFSYYLDTLTGRANVLGRLAVATDIGGAVGPSTCDGVEYAVGADLWASGRLIGHTGVSGITGLVIRDPCQWADNDTAGCCCPVDIFDFLAFQNRFYFGHPYACDADTSTGAGVCDVFDFLFFSNTYDWCHNP